MRHPGTPPAADPVTTAMRRAKGTMNRARNRRKLN